MSELRYQFASRVSSLIPNPLREQAKHVQRADDYIKLTYGYPSNEAFPIEKLARLSDKIYRQHAVEFMQYGETEGIPRLREQIKARLHQYQDLDVMANDVLITSGSTQGMDLVFKIFVNEGDTVLTEEQTFIGAVNSIKSYGGHAQGLPFDMVSGCIDTGALEATLAADTAHHIKLLYLIPTFQNPIGTSMSFEKRQEVYDICQKHQIMIYEDDPYGDLLYSEIESIPKIKSLDTTGNVIYAGSFSKILAPGSRLGYLLAPKSVFDKLVLVKQVADSFANLYWQYLASQLMDDYDFNEHIDYLRQLYKVKADAMVGALRDYATQNMTFVVPDGGYFISVKLNDDIDPSTFYDALDQHHVGVIPGNIMSAAGQGYERYFRLNFTLPSVEEIETGIKRIAQAATVAKIKQQMVF
ncbi:PLP-dependent aminotransferase family protein [Leuconostoc carnosum]|uniref:aminotransferase-like domain-containing protein n=1 Tax=Leuconostoc carnosum TaxID=1252 RepID=UPI0012394C18|nr:PLP-dependent aminotransferase family protein [Leuconostoc carnosum]KAA8369482.1 PLP-dependent aminotransferase family protein [Leuconostoc carnosum]KAA8380500.1 PLP-dependent aminotransferase family protein [Leuconostoc carnosum]